MRVTDYLLLLSFAVLTLKYNIGRLKARIRTGTRAGSSMTASRSSYSQWSDLRRPRSVDRTMPRGDLGAARFFFGVNRAAMSRHTRYIELQ
jgi:hypothetical protein